MEINEEKRKKFMEYAGKRVNNVLHDIQILEPMSRSTSYDFTKQDVEEMFVAMQDCLNNTKAEFDRKFEEKARSEKKVFSFGKTTTTTTCDIAVPAVDYVTTKSEVETTYVENTTPTVEVVETTEDALNVSDEIVTTAENTTTF